MRSRNWISAIDPDIVQLSGNETSTTHRIQIARPGRSCAPDADALHEAIAWLAAGCERIVVDAAHGAMLGGTGQFWPQRDIAHVIANACRSCSPADSAPANVAQAVREVPGHRCRCRIWR